MECYTTMNKDESALYIATCSELYILFTVEQCACIKCYCVCAHTNAFKSKRTTYSLYTQRDTQTLGVTHRR